MVYVVGLFLPLRKVGNVYRGQCPFHVDVDPSFTVYEQSAYCFGCNRFFNPVDFVKEMKKLTFWGAIEWLETVDGIVPVQFPREKEVITTPIDREIIEYWHSMVDREYHHTRMITDKTIDFYRLGWDGTRHTIPVWEDRPGESKVINVKLRGNDPKYLNLRGRGHPKLFNKWILELTDWAIVFIGEYDAILGTQDGLPCVSGTGGQNTWLPEWTEWLSKMDTIFVVPDIGEETAGYNITSNFLGKAKLCSFPPGLKDYTVFRQNGNSQQAFCGNILGVEYNVQAFIN